MRERGRYHEEWDEDSAVPRYDQQGLGSDRYQRMAYGDDDGGYGGAYADEDALNNADDDERGLVLRQDESLVGISSTVTHHGAPMLSYTRTMHRFYANRKQRLSLGRHKCEVCGERIRFWSFQTPSGSHTHDGCYERLAWTWTNLYAQQQQMAADGRFE